MLISEDVYELHEPSLRSEDEPGGRGFAPTRHKEGRRKPKVTAKGSGISPAPLKKPLSDSDDDLLGDLGSDDEEEMAALMKGFVGPSISTKYTNGSSGDLGTARIAREKNR